MRGPWASSALSLRLRLRGARARTNTSPMSSTAARVVHPAAAAPPPPRPRRLAPARCAAGSATDTATAGPTRVTTVSNRGDSLAICRVLNGMWQTSGGWGRIDRDAAVDAMLAHADAGLSTFDMADHYGPAEDLYGMFINRIRRERPPEFLEEVKGLTKWVPPPVKMTRSYVEDNINRSRKRMDVTALDMLQFHWWEYSNPGYLDALKHITDLKEEGKIKTVALTNFDTDRLQIILENGIPVVSNQVQHSIVDMRPQQRMAELCQLTGVRLITYGTVMGGLLSEKFLDTNVSIPFAGPPLNTPSLQKYKRTSVAGSMVGVRLGLSEHIKDTNAIFSLELDEEDMNIITEVSKRGRNLIDIIGDCGDEYRA
ncbi:putative oxidoreductase [Zea mays]|uniref:Aldo-keto reductase/ oxidoreductase n=2 Tax=Zea mays TaxID=4577 RepID=A0A1D6ELX2_MAIZE|nr:Aldo-keto reductase/ oxidoreductase [Zea mays]PWZ40885.1 putative oxidoreductase [Zea mays]